MAHFLNMRLQPCQFFRIADSGLSVSFQLEMNGPFLKNRHFSFIRNYRHTSDRILYGNPCAVRRGFMLVRRAIPFHCNKSLGQKFFHLKFGIRQSKSLSRFRVKIHGSLPLYRDISKMSDGTE